MINKATLNLGCGSRWKELYPSYVGLDIIDYSQDYVGDVLKVLPNLTDDTLEEVIANHFLEHFTQKELKIIFFNVNRLLKVGGVFKFVVPHMKKKRSWILAHCSFWNEDTINWLGEEDADKVYGFGKWKVEKVVTNARKDIHVELRKIL